MKKGIFVFDYDGTLFDTMTADKFAFERTLAHFGLSTISTDEMEKLIGLTIEDIAAKCLGDVSDHHINKFSHFFTQCEIEATYRTGRLYSGISELLNTLAEQNCIMEICSYGNKAYLDANIHKFKLNRYFRRIHTSDSNMPKVERLAEIKQTHQIDYGVMVGDRSIDISAGKANGFVTVGALYGFGSNEVKDADYTATDPYDLQQILLKIKHQYSK